MDGHSFILLSRQSLLRGLLCTTLVDSHPTPRVSEFESFRELVKSGERADLLIVDCDTCFLTERQAEELVRHRYAKWVVYLTDVPGAYHLHCILRYGFQGMLHKRDSVEDFRLGVAAVLRGNIYVSARVPAHDRNLFVRMLSEREVAAIRAMVVQPVLKRAAQDLGVSLATLRTHRRNIFCKLELGSQAELISFAVKVGLVSLHEPFP